MQKRVPLRQCLGCREMKPKKELVRVVRSPEGEVSIDLKGKKPGRGAYVCRSADCLKKALRSNALGRSLDTAIPETLHQALVAELEAGHGAE